MKKYLMAFLALTSAAIALYETGWIGVQPDGSILIPTGQTLTPAGVHIEVSDRPLGMVISPDGGLLAVATGSNFSPRSLHLVDIGAEVGGPDYPDRRQLCRRGVRPDGTAGSMSAAAATTMSRFLESTSRTAGSARRTAIGIPGSAPSGLAVERRRRHPLRRAEPEARTRRGRSHQHARWSPRSRSAAIPIPCTGRTEDLCEQLGRAAARTADRWTASLPRVLDARGIPGQRDRCPGWRRSPKVLRHIDVGLHPSAMALSPTGGRLYVAMRNSDSISVVDTETDRRGTTPQRALSFRTRASGKFAERPGAQPRWQDSVCRQRSQQRGRGRVNSDKTGNPVLRVYSHRLVSHGRGAEPVTSGSSISPAATVSVPSPRLRRTAGKGRSYRDRVGRGLDARCSRRGGAGLLHPPGMANNRARQTPGAGPADRRHPIPMDPGQAVPHTARVSTSSKRTARMTRCSATFRGQRRSRRWCSSGAKSRRTTMR